MLYKKHSSRILIILILNFEKFCFLNSQLQVKRAGVLNYLQGKECKKSTFIKEIDTAVTRAKKHERWKVDYMTLLMRDQMNREEGRAEGLEEGRLSVLKRMIEQGIEETVILELGYTKEEINRFKEFI